MKKTLQICICVLFVSAAAGTLRADEVTDWNAMLFRAAIAANSSPLNMTRFAALVEAAVFDAVNGIDRRYTAIHVEPAAPAGASRRAAAVQAAYRILVKLYGQGGVSTPNQQQVLDSRRAASLASISGADNTASVMSGITWGDTVAEAIWAWRSTDGFSLVQPSWEGFTTLGQWRPTVNDPYPSPLLLAKGAGYPQFSSMTPWVMTGASQFRPAGPLALNNPQYARDFNETRIMGSRTSAARTSEQTVYSWFWATSTAPALWNQTALSIIAKRHGDSDDDHDERGGHDRNTLLQNARVLAALNVAMADAAIGCWDAKYSYNFWRPITAIREAADDGNAATTPDPAWIPLFATPAHPDYPSGHSCVSGAAAVILASAFGDHTRFDVTNDLLIGVTRSFRGFDEALEEIKNARIFAGIHFRTACEDGTTLGAAVAEYVLANKFLRVK